MTQNEIKKIKDLKPSDRIIGLKKNMLEEKRYLSIEQAKIITEYYKKNENKPRSLQRAECLAAALEKITIKIDPEDLIVGNRTPGVRGGVVSPEAGISWVDREIETLPNRPQDKFNVKPEDIADFRENILPYWKEKSLEDIVSRRIGDELSKIGKVAKINQTDHAQGHICPNAEKWIKLGPEGLKKEALERMKNAGSKKKVFYQGIITVLDGAKIFSKRYAEPALEMSEKAEYSKVKILSL